MSLKEAADRTFRLEAAGTLPAATAMRGRRRAHAVAAPLVLERHKQVNWRDGQILLYGGMFTVFVFSLISQRGKEGVDDARASGTDHET